MDLELINPFLNEQDLEQFAPASVPKKKKINSEQPYAKWNNKR